MKWHLLITAFGYVSGIDLSNRDFIEVPLEIPPNETDVISTQNKIRVIRENAFVALTELIKLWLNQNAIETIEPGAFNGLVKLKSLFLWHNNLQTFPDSSVFSGLSSLLYLYMGGTYFGVINTTQLGALSNLRLVSLNHISPDEIELFLEMPNLKFVNFRGNGMMDLSIEILKKLSGLQKLWLGHNKLSSLPELGGVEGQISELDLNRNRLMHVPDLSKYVNLAILDLSDNYITLVPKESLSHIQSGTVNLEGNPVICVSELCWLVSGSWPFEVQLTCPNGTSLTDVDQTVICEGKTAQLDQMFRSLLGNIFNIR